MDRPTSATLIARQAVADVSRQNPTPSGERFAKFILNGDYDDHIEVRVAIRAVELTLENSDRKLP